MPEIPVRAFFFYLIKNLFFNCELKNILLTLIHYQTLSFHFADIEAQTLILSEFNLLERTLRKSNQLDYDILGTLLKPYKSD